ncbi:MAG: hypothetical protein JJ895_15875 [Balneolaceae bacterium]|nr:hypothetical protein [Balneolaceae bacterium]
MNTPELGIGSFTIKTLCEYHNSSTSQLDSEAIKFNKTIDEWNSRAKNTRSLPVSRVPKRVFKIDGLLLERWLLKALINNIFSFSDENKNPMATNWNPSQELVKIVYGDKAFSGNMGLYYVDAPFDIKTEEFFFIKSLFKEDEIFAAIIKFRGFQFLLNFTENHPPSFKHECFKSGNQVIHFGGTPVYRRELIQLKRSSKVIQEIKFNWI